MYPHPPRAATPVVAQPARVAGVNQAIVVQIRPRMKQYVDDKTVAGVVTLVAHGGDVVEFDAAGMADMEAGRAMQKVMIFQIMSMTKP